VRQRGRGRRDENLDTKEIAIFAAILCGVKFIVLVIWYSIGREDGIALISDGLEALKSVHRLFTLRRTLILSTEY
jgi:predicted hydrocarbon binding protein